MMAMNSTGIQVLISRYGFEDGTMGRSLLTCFGCIALHGKPHFSAYHSFLS